MCIRDSNSGAYISEIMRSGILSVDSGQMEGGRSVGLSYGVTMLRIEMCIRDSRQLCIGVSVVLDRALQQQARAAYVPLLQQPCGQLGQTRIQEPIDLAEHIFDFKFLRKIGQRFFVSLCDCVPQFFLGRLFGRPQRFVYACLLYTSRCV